MLQFQLNGEDYPLPESLTLAQLIEELQLTGRRFAVEIDGEVVPRSQFTTTLLRPNSRVEMIHAIGGG